MYTYTHTNIHTYIHTYINTYIHTYIHTCAHACAHHTYIPAAAMLFSQFLTPLMLKIKFYTKECCIHCITFLYITLHYTALHYVTLRYKGLEYTMLGFVTSGLALQPSFKNWFGLVWFALLWFALFIHPFSHNGHSTLRNVILPLVTCLIVMKCDIDIFLLAGCDSNARLIPSGL